MNFREWSKATSGYSRTLLQSGREGAISGLESYLRGTQLRPLLQHSALKAFTPAMLGACIGVLGGYPGTRRHSARRSFARGFLGCALGFGAGVFWQTRRLAASIATGALRNISRARDDHWLERHPIDYA